MSLRKYNEALKDMNTALSLQTLAPQAKTLARLGRCQLNLGNASEAISTLEKAISIDPTVAGAQADISKANNVIRAFNSIRRDKESNEWGMVVRGLDEAERYVDRPPIEWKELRLTALIARRRMDDASSLALNLLRDSPTNPELLLLRGKVLYHQGSNAQAITHLQEALRCDPDFKPARAFIKEIRSIDAKKEEGNVAFKAGNLEEAIQKYDETIEMIGDKSESLRITLLNNKATAKCKVSIKY